MARVRSEQVDGRDYVDLEDLRFWLRANIERLGPTHSATSGIKMVLDQFDKLTVHLAEKVKPEEIERVVTEMKGWLGDD